MNKQVRIPLLVFIALIVSTIVISVNVTTMRWSNAYWRLHELVLMQNTLIDEQNGVLKEWQYEIDSLRQDNALLQDIIDNHISDGKE